MSFANFKIDHKNDNSDIDKNISGVDPTKKSTGKIGALFPYTREVPQNSNCCGRIPAEIEAVCPKRLLA